MTNVRRLASMLVASILLASPLLAPTSAQAAAKPLTCRAHMSDATPKQYTNVRVLVKTGKPRANVRAVAHYKTSTTAHSRKSSAKGQASIPFYISGATPGRRVSVSVTVKLGGQTRTCSTSFRPHK